MSRRARLDENESDPAVLLVLEKERRSRGSRCLSLVADALM